MGARASDAVDLFFYGTLRDPELREVVLGPSAGRLAVADAAIEGYRCAPVAGGRFPVLVEAPGVRADGVLVSAVPLDAAARVSAFEDEGYDYAAARVTVESGGVHRTAWAFLSAGRLRAGRGAWSIERWRAVHRRAFLAAARREMDGLDAARLARHRSVWRMRLAAARRQER